MPSKILAYDFFQKIYNYNDDEEFNELIRQKQEEYSKGKNYLLKASFSKESLKKSESQNENFHVDSEKSSNTDEELRKESSSSLEEINTTITSTDSISTRKKEDQKRLSPIFSQTSSDKIEEENSKLLSGLPAQNYVFWTQSPQFMQQNFYFGNAEFGREDSQIYEANKAMILNYSLNLMKDKIYCIQFQGVLKAQPKFVNKVLLPQMVSQIDENSFKELVCHRFANFSFQILVELLTEENLFLFIEKIKNNFLEISINNFGTRVVQKIICIIKRFNEEKLARKLREIIEPILRELLKELHGNHIIQKFIDEVNVEKEFLVEHFQSHFMDIINHKHACCTFQKIYKASDRETRDKFLGLIKKNLDSIIYTEFGNFSLHFLFAFEKYEVKMNLLYELLPTLDKICLQRYSSGIIEQILESDFRDGQQLIIQRIASSESFIINISVSQFGNYILQKMFKYCDYKTFKRFLRVLAKNETRIRLNFIGNKVINNLKENYPEYAKESNSLRYKNEKQKMLWSNPN